MRLFEIANQIEDLINRSVDVETGEIPPEALDELEKLEMDRDQKALAIAAYAKGEWAEAEAVRAEAKVLFERAKRASNRGDRLRELLERYLPVETKIKDARVEIGWRKSAAVEITDEAALPEDFWRHPPPEVNKKAIGDAIREGRTIPGACLAKRIGLVVR